MMLPGTGWREAGSTSCRGRTDEKSLLRMASVGTNRIRPAGFVFRHHLIRFRTASPQPPTS